MFETLTTLPESIHFGTLVSYAYLLPLLYRFAPAYRVPPVPSSIRYYPAYPVCCYDFIIFNVVLSYGTAPMSIAQ